jgi:hypothetical protein
MSHSEDELSREIAAQAEAGGRGGGMTTSDTNERSTTSTRPPRQRW